MMATVLALLALGGAYWVFSPLQDRESKAYLEWASAHEELLSRQHRNQRRFLEGPVRFSELELVNVAPGSAYYSWLGHLLLRLKGSGKTPREDWTVGFLADFKDFPVNRWKASFGGYEILPKLGPYSEFEAEYLQGEHRWMRGTVIRTTPEQRERFLGVLRKWVEKPERIGTYSFFSANCVGLLNRLLIESSILDAKVVDVFPLIPERIPELYSRAGLIDAPRTEAR